MSTIKADAIVASTGTNTNIAITGKGTGKVALGDGALLFPDADGTANQVIETDGAGALSFVTASASGLEWVETHTLSGTASTGVLLANQNMEAGYDYIVIWNEYRVTIGGEINMTMAQGATPTLLSSGYAGVKTTKINNTWAHGSISTTYMHTYQAAGGPLSWWGKVELFGPGDSAPTHYTSECYYTGAAGQDNWTSFQGVNSSTTPITALELKGTLGNFTGTVKVYRRKSA